MDLSHSRCGNRSDIFQVRSVILCLLLCTSACDTPLGVDVKYSLKIKNNSPVKLYTGYSMQYPDTSIPTDQGQFQSTFKEGSFEADVEWDKLIDELPKDSISIFFMCYDTVAKYGWDDVRVNYRILERRDLGSKYYRENNGTISYP